MAKLEMRNAKLMLAGDAVERVRDFTGLEVWRLARQLRQLICNLASRFPVEERFTLAQQIRRAAISVTANIAEGFGRYSYQEDIQFLPARSMLGPRGAGRLDCRLRLGLHSPG